MHPKGLASWNKYGGIGSLLKPAKHATREAIDQTTDIMLQGILQHMAKRDEVDFISKIQSISGKSILILCLPIDIIHRGSVHDRFIVAADIDGNTLVINLTKLRAEHQEAFQTILISQEEKILFNGKETLAYLSQKGLNVCGKYFDITIAHKLLNTGLEDKLNYNKVYEFIDHYSQYEHRKQNPASNEINESLFQTHVKMTHLLANQLKELLHKTKLENVAQIEFQLLPLLVKFESDGISFNSLVWNEKKHMFPNVMTDYGKYLDSNSGRIHPKYTQIGTETGRITCSSPNLQGVPRIPDLRACFVPSEGNIFVNADYSQMELRIVAEISGDETMKCAYQEGRDLHKLTAQIITGKTEAELTKDDRQAAKAVNFGLIYGMGVFGLISYAKERYGVNMSEADAQIFIHRFFESYKGLASWQTKTRNSSASETRSILSRRRRWSKIPKYTELYNTPVQSTGADILKTALVLLSTRICANEAKIVAVVHDEIMLEVPEAEAEKYKLLLYGAMSDAWIHVITSVPAEIEVKICNNWADK